MKPYLDKGVFKKLKNINFFNTVEIKFVTISCGENIDMCADSLYDTSEATVDNWCKRDVCIKTQKPTNTIKVGVGFYVRKLHFKKRKQ